MWNLTFSGLIIGCLFSASIMLNLTYFLAFSVDQKLLIGLLIAFPIWAGVMTFFYGADSVKQAWKRITLPFIVSVGINVFYFMS